MTQDTHPAARLIAAAVRDCQDPIRMEREIAAIIARHGAREEIAKTYANGLRKMHVLAADGRLIAEYTAGSNQVGLKIVAGSKMTASWIACPLPAAELIICDIPAGTGLDTVIRLANETVINLDSRRKTAPQLPFERLGRDKFVNLGLGRPEGSTSTERTATIPATRCTPEQRATWEALGGVDWLRAALDKARAKK